MHPLDSLDLIAMQQIMPGGHPQDSFCPTAAKVFELAFDHIRLAQSCETRTAGFNEKRFGIDTRRGVTLAENCHLPIFAAQLVRQLQQRREFFPDGFVPLLSC